MIEQAIERGIIEPKDLHAIMHNEDNAVSIKLLDATFYLPTSDQNAEENYNADHINGAQFFDIKASANPDSNIPNMLPNPPDFERMVTALGINNDDTIVLYGQTGMVMGTARVWWMFRVFGHDKVIVLNGGLPAWKAEGFPTTNSLPEQPERGGFKAVMRQDLVKSKDNVKTAMLRDDIKIVDARGAKRFAGTAEEPRPRMRSGHIPSSCNVPSKSLVDSETGKLKSEDELNIIFSNAGCTGYTSLITTCGSGTTACMLALALFHTGRKDVPVYDGSWSEWGSEHAGTPIECAN